MTKLQGIHKNDELEMYLIDVLGISLGGGDWDEPQKPSG
jgi:hypothetical protein